MIGVSVLRTPLGALHKAFALGGTCLAGPCAVFTFVKHHGHSQGIALCPGSRAVPTFVSIMVTPRALHFALGKRRPACLPRPSLHPPASLASRYLRDLFGVFSMS